MPSTVYGDAKDVQVQKVLCAAAGDGAKPVGVRPLADAKAGHACPFSSPSYHDGSQTLCGATAIMWEVAGAQLRGQTPALHSQVICWLSYCDAELRPTVMAHVLHAASCISLDKKAGDSSRDCAHHVLELLNDYLLPRTFLVGERLSLADISVALDLWPLFEHVLDASSVAKYQNVTRWFLTVVNQPQVAGVIGEVNFCERPAQFDGKKFKENEAKMRPAQSTSACRAKTASESSGKGKKEKKAKEPKAKAKPKEVDEPEEEMDETEMIKAAEEKKKDPFGDFPKGTFVMDDFKRVYSNEDTVAKAIPYFWENFDTENYSLWHCEYKYPEDLTMVFMSANLMGGMLQRLDKMRKHAFGSLCLFGTNSASTISGVWLWRGHELAFTLSNDWQIDYDSYEWKKLDPKDEGVRKMVNEYLAWEGDFGGKTFNQGKIFK